jgi:hypothetical protein
MRCTIGTTAIAVATQRLETCRDLRGRLDAAVGTCGESGARSITILRGLCALLSSERTEPSVCVEPPLQLVPPGPDRVTAGIVLDSLVP